MRRIITFSLLFISVLVVYGENPCDSVKVFFALNKATFNPTLDNNAASMEEFIDGLVAAENSGTLDHIAVYGYASPEGPFLNNDRLSIQRCKAVAEYISRHAGIPLNEIQTHHGSVAWDGLRALVVGNTHTPNRNAVLRILNEHLPDACTDRDKSDRCREDLIAIDGGQVYKWMLENLFPGLRYSLAVYAYHIPESSNDQPVIEQTHLILDALEIEPQTMPAEDIEVIIPSYIDFTGLTRPLHRFAIKTNLLYYAALLPNLEVEWRINSKWSVALEGDIAWWGSYSKERSYRLMIAQPEVRRWIRPRAPWHGFYVGAFAGGGLYDFEKPGRGYYGEGVMGGLSVGYMWPLNRNLSFEAAVGGGYLFTRYKEYIQIEGHHVYQRTKDLNYFGPLKVKLSLVWRLWDINRRLKAERKTGNVI